MGCMDEEVSADFPAEKWNTYQIYTNDFEMQVDAVTFCQSRV